MLYLINHLSLFLILLGPLVEGENRHNLHMQTRMYCQLLRLLYSKFAGTSSFCKSISHFLGMEIRKICSFVLSVLKSANACTSILRMKALCCPGLRGLTVVR